MNSKQKAEGLFICILLAFQSALDVISIASLLPLIVVVTNSRVVLNYPLLNQLTFEDAVLAMSAVVFALLLIKTTYAKFVAYVKARFAYRVSEDVAGRLLHAYFSLSHQHFTDTDHTREMNRLANVPLTYANNLLIPIGNALSEIVVAVLLVIALAYYNLELLALTFIMVVPGALLFIGRRKRLQQRSSRFNELYPPLLKTAMQAVQAWPDIITLGKQAFFLQRFKERQKLLTEHLVRDHVETQFSSRLMELFASSLLLITIIYTILTTSSAASFLITLSVYGGAAIRLVPSLTKISGAYTQMQVHAHILTELQPVDTHPSTVDQPSTLSFTHQIELKNVSVLYQEMRVLENLSVIFKKGDLVMISGKSGSGKTTLFRALLGWTNLSSGAVLLDGKPLSSDSLASWHSLVTYIPQNPYLIDGSLLENIAFGIPAASIDAGKVQQIIRKLGLTEWVESLPQNVLTTIGEGGVKISGGQRQRIALARALYRDTQVLLLDEITNQLDHATTLQILSIITQLNEAGVTIIMITHNMALSPFFRDHYQLQDSKLVKMAELSITS